MSRLPKYKNIGEETLVELAKKYNLPLSIISIIANTPFRKLKELQKEGSFKTLMLPYFGKFLVKPGMKERIKLLRELRVQQVLAKENNKDQQLDY